MAERFLNNENRGRHRDAINTQQPARTVHDHNSVSANEMPPSIRPDAPLCTDPHAQGRHSFDNLSVKPGEKARSRYTTETRRRLTLGSGDRYE
jgi:hypothetical protein